MSFSGDRRIRERRKVIMDWIVFFTLIAQALIAIVILTIPVCASVLLLVRAALTPLKRILLENR